MKIKQSLREFQKQEKELLGIFQKEREKRELAYFAEHGADIIVELFQRIRKLESKMEEKQDKIEVERIYDGLVEKHKLAFRF